MNTPRTVSDQLLRTDLNELAHALVRELAVACKKMGIYGKSHPLAAKALEKPFLLLSKFFQFRRYVNINLQRGQLYVVNIWLKDSIFNGQIIQFMQILDVTAIVFDNDLSMDDFTTFVERFVQRINLNDPEAHLSAVLKRKNVTSVQVNSELAFNMFEKQKQYRGEVDGDFSVQRFCLDQLSEDPLHLVTIRHADSDELLRHYVDFTPQIVQYLLPDKIASISVETIRDRLNRLGSSYSNALSEMERSTALENLIGIFRLLDAHPARDQIAAELDDEIKKKLELPEEVGDPASATGQIKLESRNRIDSLMDNLFTPDPTTGKSTELCDAFQRLLKTGQWQKAEETVSDLLDRLGDPDPRYRQEALHVLTTVVSRLSPVTDSGTLKAAVTQIISRLSEHNETYEYSELIWQVFEKCRQDRRFDLMATITTTMAKRRRVENDVSVYDSMAVKKAFENINQRHVIESLVEDMIKADYDTSQYLQDILIAIGSNEIALVLSENISHPMRRVRQQALRILAELGKATLRVFSDILMDDRWFERPDDRHELPDAKWYVLRNSIFVLGLLKDESGIAPLRLRMTDSDVRIRREIVAALEKIGGEEAVDLLVLMAEDTDREIREKAVIAVGVIGITDSAPLLIDVAKRNPSESIRIVNALGKLGGHEARTFLTSILDSEERLTELAGGLVSKDELRVAIIRALGNIGDQEAIDSIRKFKDQLSTAQKIFFKQSSLQKTIADVLSRY